MAKLREYELAKPGAIESELPDYLQYCMMDVLTHSTKLPMRAFLAGEHQRKQALCRSSQMQDFFRLVLEVAVKRRPKTAKPDQVLERVMLFNDTELWALIERSGMKVDEQIRNPMAYNPEITEKQALTLKKRLV